MLEMNDLKQLYRNFIEYYNISNLKKFHMYSKKKKKKGKEVLLRELFNIHLRPPVKSLKSLINSSSLTVINLTKWGGGLKDHNPYSKSMPLG